jgi:putative transcriptional regulator
LKNRVSDLRQARGLSQGDLGKLVGVSRQAINAVERGKHDPSLMLAFKIANAFDLPVEQVFDAEL